MAGAASQIAARRASHSIQAERKERLRPLPAVRAAFHADARHAHMRLVVPWPGRPCSPLDPTDDRPT